MRKIYKAQLQWNVPLSLFFQTFDRIQRTIDESWHESLATDFTELSTTTGSKVTKTSWNHLGSYFWQSGHIVAHVVRWVDCVKRYGLELSHAKQIVCSCYLFLSVQIIIDKLLTFPWVGFYVFYYVCIIVYTIQYDAVFISMMRWHPIRILGNYPIRYFLSWL